MPVMSPLVVQFAASTSTGLSATWWEYVLLFFAVAASWAGVPAIGSAAAIHSPPQLAKRGITFASRGSWVRVPSSPPRKCRSDGCCVPADSRLD
jgi:hypothetical protein